MSEQFASALMDQHFVLRSSAGRDAFHTPVQRVTAWFDCGYTARFHSKRIAYFEVSRDSAR